MNENAEKSPLEICIDAAVLEANDAGIRDAAREQLDRLKYDVKEAWQHYEALDQNWEGLHRAAMEPIRKALGLPDGSVAELIARIDELKRNDVRRIVKFSIYEDFAVSHVDAEFKHRGGTMVERNTCIEAIRSIGEVPLPEDR